MIQMLRKEAVSGAIDDLGHVRTADMMADCLTKASVKADNLVRAVETGILPNCDASPEFRKGLKHKAYFVGWLCSHLAPPSGRRDFKHMKEITHFMGEDVSSEVNAYFSNFEAFSNLVHADFEDCARSFSKGCTTLSGRSGRSLSTGTVASATAALAQPNSPVRHQHKCSACDAIYSHIHQLPSEGITHDHSDSPMCPILGCSRHFGTDVRSQNNPYYATAVNLV